MNKKTDYKNNNEGNQDHDEMQESALENEMHGPDPESVSIFHPLNTNDQEARIAAQVRFAQEISTNKNEDESPSQS